MIAQLARNSITMQSLILEKVAFLKTSLTKIPVLCTINIVTPSASWLMTLSPKVHLEELIIDSEFICHFYGAIRLIGMGSILVGFWDRCSFILLGSAAAAAKFSNVTWEFWALFSLCILGRYLHGRAAALWKFFRATKQFQSQMFELFELFGHELFLLLEPYLKLLLTPSQVLSKKAGKNPTTPAIILVFKKGNHHYYSYFEQ